MSQWQVLVDLAMGIGRANIFGFGGGPAVIPLIENEACERYHWLTQEEFANALVIGNSLPGPIATKMGTYIGYKLMGIPGAVVALTATVLPSALAMLLLFALLNKYRTLPFVKGMMNGVKPVVWVLFILLAIDYIKFVGDRQNRTDCPGRVRRPLLLLCTAHLRYCDRHVAGRNTAVPSGRRHRAPEPATCTDGKCHARRSAPRSQRNQRTEVI